MVEDVLKFKSGGEAVLQEYQETETITDATRRQMINILVALMIDKHGYLIFVLFLISMAIVQIKITSLISSLRQLPTNTIRKQNYLGIVIHPRKAPKVIVCITLSCHTCNVMTGGFYDIEI